MKKILQNLKGEKYKIMPKLIIENEDEFDLEDNSSIKKVCEDSGIPFACEEGVCGTCVIEIIDGHENLTPPTEEEEDFLGEDTDEERLACQCKIKSGTVKVKY